MQIEVTPQQLTDLLYAVGLTVSEMYRDRDIDTFNKLYEYLLPYTEND